MTRRYPLLEVILLFCLSLAIFLWNISSQELIGFESRFYLFALEMKQFGLTWFPTTYQQPYPDYPVTATLFIYLAAQWLGELNKLTAVLPNAIAAAVTVAMTYLIGASRDKRWGNASAAFLLLTYTFFANARSLSLDLYPTMVTAICFYLAFIKEPKHSASPNSWIYLWLVLGFAFRGPIGLVMPAGVVSFGYLLDGRVSKTIKFGLIASVLLVLCTTMLLSMAYIAGGEQLVHSVLRMQVLGRMEQTSVSPYYYWLSGMSGFALSFPIALLVLILGFLEYFKNKPPIHWDFVQKLAVWAAVILIGMSIPGDKKLRYILPLSPAIALLAAFPFAASIKEKSLLSLSIFLTAFFLLFPLFIMIGLLLLPFFSFPFHVPIMHALIFLSLLQFTTILFFYISRDKAYCQQGILWFACMSFIILFYEIIEPVQLQLDSARAFVQQVEAKRLLKHLPLGFYKEKPDSLPIKYLINMPHLVKPYFIEDEQQLIKMKRPMVYITSEAHFHTLSHLAEKRAQVIAKDSLGHVKVVAFSFS